jgi:hypothetical protein
VTLIRASAPTCVLPRGARSNRWWLETVDDVLPYAKCPTNELNRSNE